MTLTLSWPRGDMPAMDRDFVQRSVIRDEEAPIVPCKVAKPPLPKRASAEPSEDGKTNKMLKKRVSFKGDTQSDEAASLIQFWTFGALGSSKNRESLGNSRTHPSRMSEAVNSFDLTAAALKGRLQEVQRLLKGKKSFLGHRSAPAHPDSTDEEGFSALFLAVQRNHLEIVRALIDAGANPNMPGNPDGATPLCLAAGEGSVACTMVLIGRGACVDTPEKGGVTALIIAAQNGHVSIVRELISRSINVDHCTEAGETALMCASRRGHVDIERMLVATGATRVPQTCENAPKNQLPACAVRNRETLIKLLGH